MGSVGVDQDAPETEGTAVGTGGREPRFRLRPGVTLRRHAARGTLINGAFTAGLTGITFLKGILVAAFLSPEDYGVWGILLISLGTLTWLKTVGVPDKYIQQDETDQELAFQRAFTMELIVNAILLAILLAAVPLMALVYGNDELLLPGFAMCLLIPAGQLQVPFWVLYRRLEFARQRLYQSIDPVVGLVVTVALAIAGAGYWSLVIGVLAGAWTGAVVAVATSPYPLRLRYDRGTLRSYARFSAPLFVASIGGIVIAQGSILFGEDALGLAGAGAITLAAQITQLTGRVDQVVSTTLYPVICSVKERRELLFETFVKSNRIALMWALPFGCGLALFAADLVDLLLGDEWQDAVVILQATGIAAALSQLGFNWSSYCRALDDTRPIAVATTTQAIAFLATVPLFYLEGFRGFAASVVLMVLAELVVRGFFLRRIFVGFGLGRHALRSIVPVLPAVGLVLALHELGGQDTHTAGGTALTLAAYVAAVAAATWVFERALLREAVGYLRRQRAGVLVPGS